MNVSELKTKYDAFEGNLYKGENRSNLLFPIDYILSLKSKRIRPLLALIGYNLYREDVDKCMHAAFGLELFHNFTLMHDDIMDRADVRRGQPSVHIKFGLNEAIISGDAMSIMAYEYIMHDCEDYNLRTVIRLFNKTAIDICIGQQMDMEFEAREVVSSEEYLEMIRLKTAIFLGLGLQVGALIAGTDLEKTYSLYKYGESLGIAFQIQDDLLDLMGDAELVGKMKGGDILRNKKTFLVCKAYEICSESQKEDLSNLLTNNNIEPKLKINKVIDLFNELHLFQLVEKEIKLYFDLASEQLLKLDLNEEQSNSLKNIAQLIQVRKN